MERENAEMTVVNADKTALDISSESQLSALSERYAARGLHRAVLETAAKQIEKEEKTREMAPDAYRLSQMPEGTVQACYRRGKEHMSSADLVRYIDQTRARRIRDVDFSAEPEEGETEAEAAEAALVAVETESKPERA